MFKKFSINQMKIIIFSNYLIVKKKKWENLTKNFNSNILQTWEYGNYKRLFFVKSSRIFNI